MKWKVLLCFWLTTTNFGSTGLSKEILLSKTYALNHGSGELSVYHPLIWQFFFEVKNQFSLSYQKLTYSCPEILMSVSLKTFFILKEKSRFFLYCISIHFSEALSHKAIMKTGKIVKIKLEICEMIFYFVW